ncbi:MAG TPA: DUF4349 domain-containing protein [Steroidobacter sp.]|uniref:DUF4349 domain-containing protein n=1 Tax=Steroidobacter sp. TaxID=1978227 RepID=UPI002ED78DAE
MDQKNAKLGFQLLVIGAFAAISGCSDKNVSGMGLAQPMPAETAAVAVAAAPPARAARSATLAYEHNITVEMDKELLPTRLREIESACNADQASGCTVLDVSLQSHQDLPSGNIRMRLAPASVESIVTLASKDAKVTSRNTRAEDLAEPVADTERQLALMTLHRDRLTEFMKSKDIKIEQLIAVSKELASVQSQIDSLSTQRANLRRRIDTELLTISLSLPQREYVADASPVMDAIRYFGNDFRQAVGTVIRFLAVLLPWLVIILPGLFLLRLFWRWIGRRLARREQTA